MADKVKEELKKKTPEQAEQMPEANAAKTEQAGETESAEDKPKPQRKKAKRNVAHGNIHVLSTFNNTIITVTDQKGNTLATSSAGASGFRGSKKGTAYAAQIAAEKAINEAKNGYGVSTVDVFVKGVGMGRDAAIRSLINQRITVESVRDVTTIAHGGVRARKPKRN